MQETNHSPATTDWDRMRPVLDDALRALSEADREAVLLRYFERRPFTQIGAAFNVTEDAARMRVERALEKLRALLGRQGITSTTAALATVLGNQVVVAAPTGLAATITGAALAGSVASGGNAAAVTGIFMSKSTIIASAAAFVALGAAAYQTQYVRRAEASLAALTHTSDDLRAQLHAAQQRGAKTEIENAEIKHDLDALLAAKASTPATKPLPTTAIGGSPVAFTGYAGTSTVSSGTLTFSSGTDASLWYALPASADPIEARRQLRAVNGTNIDANFIAFYQQLGLTPAQREQFRELKLDSNERSNEQFRAATAAARMQNPSADRAALQVVFDQTNARSSAEFETALRDTFGDATLQAYRYFNETNGVRQIANQLATALFYSDTPLTAPQANQLVEIMANNARTAQGKIDPSAMNHEAVLAQAQSVLSEPQHAMLRKNQAQWTLRLSGATPKPAGN